MIREKIQQAFQILSELDIDAWMIFGRESHTSPDPCAELVVGTEYTWASAFILTRTGRSIALVGSLDAAEMEKQGNYETVVSYVGGIREDLRRILTELNPSRLAVNYSMDDVMADGLTHGMYLLLQETLADTPYGERLVSSSPVVAALRGRKSSEELRRIQVAVDRTEELYELTRQYIRPGLTEKQVAAYLLQEVRKRGYELAWCEVNCPSVFTGMPDAGEAHTGPTDKVIERGHVLNMDFGLRIDGYCSDLQRTGYVLREGETSAPPEVERGFRTIVDAIRLAAEAAKPGVDGWVVDDVARSHITQAGYDEFPHGLGHQVGRSPHDGAGGFFPKWERYRTLPFLKIEEGQVYTIEPRLRIEGYGTATVEDMIVVTPEGGRFISSFQQELWLLG